MVNVTVYSCSLDLDCGKCYMVIALTALDGDCGEGVYSHSCRKSPWSLLQGVYSHTTCPGLVMTNLTNGILPAWFWKLVLPFLLLVSYAA